MRDAIERCSQNELHQTHPMLDPRCQGKGPSKCVAWGVQCWAPWLWVGPMAKAFGRWFDGETEAQRESALEWNHLTSKVGSAPVACSIPGAETFSAACQALRLGSGKSWVALKGYAHPRGLSRGPMGSQHTEWGLTLPPSLPLPRLQVPAVLLRL